MGNNKKDKILADAYEVQSLMATGLSERAVARGMGVNVTNVRKLIRLLSATPEVIESINREEITCTTVITAISHIGDPIAASAEILEAVNILGGIRRITLADIPAAAHAKSVPVARISDVTSCLLRDDGVSSKKDTFVQYNELLQEYLLGNKAYADIAEFINGL